MVGPVADTERLVPEVDEEVRVLGFVYVQRRGLEGVLRLMNARDDRPHTFVFLPTLSNASAAVSVSVCPPSYPPAYWMIEF